MPMFAQDLEKQHAQTLKELRARREMARRARDENKKSHDALNTLRNEIAAKWGVPPESITMAVCRRGLP